MSYVGNKPAQTTIPVDDSVTTAMLKDDAVTSAKIDDLTIVNADINASAAIANSKMASDTTSASNISTGTLGSARMGSGSASSSTVLYGDGTWKAEPVTDTSGLRNDISTLALHSAIADNKAAFNLTNSFIDQYEDATGIDVLTDVVRDTTGEYMSTLSGVGGNDSYTKLLLHLDGSDDGTIFADSSGSSHTISKSGASDPRTKTAIKKFGTASGKWNDATYLSTPDSADWFYDDGDWTIDWWHYITSHCPVSHFDFVISQVNAPDGSGSDQIYIGTRRTSGSTYYMMANASGGVGSASVSTLTFALDTWRHLAICQNADKLYFYVDGVSTEGVGIGKTSTVAFPNLNTELRVGYQQDVEYYNGYADEIRISKGIARFPGGLTFTPFTSPYDTQTLNATGNYTSTSETANATVSKMGIVVLYENTSGTATLDTDLVAQVSADGGSNYVSAPLTAGGTFSTGVLVAKSNDITISNTGTAPKYKISFANQADGSKETRVRGVALLY